MELEDYMDKKTVQTLTSEQYKEVCDMFGIKLKPNIYERLHGDKIIKKPKNDLLQYLKIEEISKDDFISMRNMLRKVDIMKRKNQITVDVEIVKELSYDGVCQLLQEKIKAKHNKQSELWYNYCEDNSLDGESLITKKCNELAEKLGLDENQKEKLKNVLEQLKTNKSTGAVNLEVKQSHAGFIAAAGGSIVNYGNAIGSSGKDKTDANCSSGKDKTNTD